MCVVNVNVNGTGQNQAQVSPGGTFNVSFDYSSVGTGSYCPTCIEQYYVGLSPDAVTSVAAGTNSSCFLSTVFSDVLQTGHISTSLVAPSNPGVYYLAIAGPTLLYGCPNASPLGTPSPGQYIGAISVYSTN
jgi:hypothetical protein